MPRLRVVPTIVFPAERVDGMYWRGSVSGPTSLDAATETACDGWLIGGAVWHPASAMTLGLIDFFDVREPAALLLADATDLAPWDNYK